MKKIRVLLALLVALGIAAMAHAHPDHDDEAPVVLYKVALASQKKGTLFLVTRDGKNVPTAGATGKLVLKKGTAKRELMLTPVGENGMQTGPGAQLAAGTQVRAMITFPDNSMATEDFLLK